MIDALETELAPLTTFIFPADPCGGRIPSGPDGLPPRRAAGGAAGPPAGGRRATALFVYLNRLSDLLFVLARVGQSSRQGRGHSLEGALIRFQGRRQWRGDGNRCGVRSF